MANILLLPDDKILIGGTFSNVGAFQTYNIARLNADGSADTTFTSALNSGSGTVVDIERQSDGKFLIAGSLGTVGGVANRIMLRLNTDGSNDSSFNNVTVDSGGVLDVALQSSGKILIGGSFFTVNGTIRRNFARLNTDGTLDTTLSAIFTGAVYAVKLQADGRILVGGTFTIRSMVQIVTKLPGLIRTARSIRRLIRIQHFKAVSPSKLSPCKQTAKF